MDILAFHFSRKRFNSILNHYGLGGSSAEMEGGVESNIKSNLRVFKDKKLDRLWEKAKAASGTSGKGMSDEELAVLKREFQHYQGKKQAQKGQGSIRQKIIGRASTH